MSVDYYSCEWCNEAIYEENCNSRSLGDEEICVCDWCIDEYIEKGLLIKMTDDDEGFNDYSPKIKENIKYFGAHYQWTTSGIKIELDNIEKAIQNLISRKSELTNKLDKMK